MSDDQHGTGSRPAQGAGHPVQEPSAGARRADTEWIGSGDPPDGGTPQRGYYDDRPRRGRRSAVIVGAAVVAVLLLGGGGVLAFQLLSGGGDQPADAIPASAIDYARVDLDPSADQKINAVRLLRSVPEFEEETGITSDTDDLRKRMFEAALEGDEGCSDISYDDDIAPWIGERAGGAAIPAAEGEEPDGLAVIQVTDEEAARDGIQALIDCSEDSDETGGIAFVGDYALLAETQELADGFAADAEEAPLSEAEGFSSDMEALDGEGLVSFWLDIDALLTYAEEEEPDVSAVLDALGYDEVGSISAAVRAQSDSLEVVYAGNSDLLRLFNPESSEPVGDVQALPETTLMALGFTGGSDSIDRLWEQLQGLEGSELAPGFGAGSLEEFAAQLEAETGFVIPDDVGVLLGDEFTMAFDGERLELSPETGEPDLSTIDVGARLRTDAAAAGDLISRVEDLLAQGGAPFELAQQEVDGGLVVAANDEYAQTLADGGSLGDSDVFDSAVADKDDAVAVQFLDLDRTAALADRVSAEVGEPLPTQVSDTLEVFRAFGASTTVDGDYSRTTVRLVFD